MGSADATNQVPQLNVMLTRLRRKRLRLLLVCFLLIAYLWLFIVEVPYPMKAEDTALDDGTTVATAKHQMMTVANKDTGFLAFQRHRCVQFTEEELCANNSCMKDILTDADTLADSNNYFFDDYRHRFRVEKYNISYCRILKCSSTLMKKVIRLLHDPIKVISNGELLYHKNMSYDESLVFEKWADKVDESSQTMANGLNESRWHHVAIIRDPMDRFLASWVFFCVKKWQKYSVERALCFNCYSDLECFIRKFVDYIRVNKTENYPTYFGHLDHFFPLSWYCNFKTNLANYTIIYNDPRNRSKFYDDLGLFFAKAKVPAFAIDFIKKKGLNEQVPHTFSDEMVFDLNKVKLRRKKHLVKMLLQVYHIDYKMFGLQLPCF